MVRNDQEMANDSRDATTGRFEKKYPDTAFIDAIEAAGGQAGTSAIAERVGCPYNTAYSALRELEADGRVEKQKVANANLWSVADE